MKYVILREVITRDYYLNKKEDAYKIIENLNKRFHGHVLTLYLGINYDNRFKWDYRLSVEIERL